MQTLNAFLRSWGPSLLVMAIIFGFSSLPSADLPVFGLYDFLVKKGSHFSGYALLGLANLRGFHRAGAGQGLRPYLLAFLLAVLYSATDEFHQSFVPGRHPLLTDIGIDSLGALTALAVRGCWVWRFSAGVNGDKEK